MHVLAKLHLKRFVRISLKVVVCLMSLSGIAG
jgi:hypothetical protein